MKILTKVLGLVGLVGILGILNNVQAYDINYDNSSWMFNSKENKCVQLSRENFDMIFNNLQNGRFPFIGGIEVNFNKDPNDWRNPEYAQFFLIPLGKGYVINALGTTSKSCQLAIQEILSGNVEKRFPNN